ncbi:hypothetical protein AB6A40_003106 [Gnathostoma spinigerum]|uniref:C2H2-type domain-containing protein n=1 Tax=Gnathostoma spinigerum TaxID=75299 RepID=A0ABD6EI87_9BILA
MFSRQQAVLYNGRQILVDRDEVDIVSTRSYMSQESSALQLTDGKIRKLSTINSRSRWLCRICGKYLSSKRSYDEHSNIHSKTRPFACEHCNYAAASQMTLRRHNLRNHTPRQKWGYQCPYCPELYMEPASYQQHVGSRHFGRSATFGCPSPSCPFTTRCSGHFRDHLSRHGNSSVDQQLGKPLSDIRSITKYLVDDKLGVGYGKRLMKKVIRAPVPIRAAADRAYEDHMKTPIDCERLIHDAKLTAAPTKSSFDSVLRLYDDKCDRSSLSVPFSGVEIMKEEDVGWIESEVVVDDLKNIPEIVHEGMVDLELD